MKKSSTHIAMLMIAFCPLFTDAQASDCLKCKRLEKGVSTTVHQTGKMIQKVGTDIGRGLDKMFGWMFKPSRHA